MLTLKTSDQLRTMCNIKSYRSCPTSTGPPMWATEWGRLHREELALCIRELRRLGRVYQGMTVLGVQELRRRWQAAARPASD